MAYQRSYCSFLRPIILGLLILLSLPVAAQCQRIVDTLTKTDVYDRPPGFSSGTGWMLGRKLDTLAAGTQVSLCESVDIGLFGDKRRWYQIRYGQDKFGWVFSQKLRLSSKEFGTVAHAGSYLMSSAIAAPDDTADDALPSFGKRGLLILALCSVLLGMVAKVLFDEMSGEESVPLRRSLKLRKFARPILAAPLTFAVFLQYGDMTMKDEIAAAITLCMAFQNGFFWQTFLTPGKSPQLAK
jgi:hypothetical protein